MTTIPIVINVVPMPFDFFPITNPPLLSLKDVLPRPNVVGDPRFHRGRDLQGLVNPPEIVPREVNGKGRFEVFGGGLIWIDTLSPKPQFRSELSNL
jgi:hypothetical protein